MEKELPAIILPRADHAIQRFFGSCAASGVIQRQLVFTAFSLVRAFVLAFLRDPDATDKDVAEVATALANSQCHPRDRTAKRKRATWRSGILGGPGYFPTSTALRWVALAICQCETLRGEEHSGNRMNLKPSECWAMPCRLAVPRTGK